MDANRIARLLTEGVAARRAGIWHCGCEAPDSTLPERLGALRLAGADAPAFLQSALTNDVLCLAEGEGTLCARLDRAGRLRALLSLHRLRDAPEGPVFLLVLERARIAPLRADLEAYLFNTDVRILDVSEQYVWITLEGPAAAETAHAVHGALEGEQWEELPEYAARWLSKGGLPDGTVAMARSFYGDPGLILAVPREADGDWRTRLETEAGARGMRALAGVDGEALAEALRLEGGYPDLTRDGAEGRVLPETGLEERTVSYTKGCYLGQEVVARLRAYGSPAQSLRVLTIVPDGDGSLPERLASAWSDMPEAGEELVLVDGRRAGRLASRAPSPPRGALLVFAWLGKAFRAPGEELSCRGRRGVFRVRVEMPPLYRATDRAARARALYDEGVRAFASGHDGESVSLFERALRLDPSFADAYETLGVVLGRAERFDEAIAVFQRLAKVSPDEPMVHTNLSLFYMRLGEKTLAEEHKAQAMLKRFRRAGAETEAGRHEAEEAERRRAAARRSRKTFEEVLALDPGDPLALCGLANALEELGETAEAERVLGKARETQPDNATLYLGHGKLLERLGRWDEAAGLYREGLLVAARKDDRVPLKEMERRLLLLRPRI